MVSIIIFGQLVDAIINSFCTSLMLLPSAEIQTFLGDFSANVLEKNVDGFKFEFFHQLLQRLEGSERWGPKIRLTMQIWGDLLF